MEMRISLNHWSEKKSQVFKSSTNVRLKPFRQTQSHLAFCHALYVTDRCLHQDYLNAQHLRCL